VNPASSDVVRSKSQIPYKYATIRITQSRLDKGLIAIPVALAESFPDHNETIQVYLNDSPVSETKQYSSYTSSTRECRIGGVRQWFEQNNIKSGDEVVIQFIDRKRFIYLLIPERNFLMTAQDLQRDLDGSKTEQEASEKIIGLARWTQTDKSKVALNELYRLSGQQLTERKRVSAPLIRTKESIPANLRVLLSDVYKGHCQVCDFWFLKRDREPYFEIHHLDPLKGHHPKNLLVVCGNCHNQLEYADVKHEFNYELWLIRLFFNKNMYLVRQALLGMKVEFFKELFV